jgi:hypothetical protein
MDPHRTSGTTQPGYETSDASTRGVTLAAVGLMLLLVLSLVVVAGLLAYFRQQAGALGPESTPVTPPSPRLQVNPAADRQAIQATQQAQLNSYGWVDQSSGVAHIPIDEAMKIIVAQGLPTLAPTPTPVETPTSTGTP